MSDRGQDDARGARSHGPWHRITGGLRRVVRAVNGRELWERWVRPLDLEWASDDPVEAFYRSNGRRFVIAAPLARCRMLGATSFACAADAGNPLVDTLVAYGRGACRAYADSPLHQFYAGWQPATVAEAVGVCPDPSRPALCARPENSPPLPWAPSPLGVPRSRRLALAQFRAARREAGVRAAEVDGIIFYGPVSDAFGEATFARLTRLFDSIRADGYHPGRHGAGHVTAQLLVRHDGEWRILVRGGKHGVAALGALRHERIPVQMAGRAHPAVVYRQDAASWPNVRAGLFTSEEAIAVFDRVFEAHQPAGWEWHDAVPRATRPA